MIRKTFQTPPSYGFGRYGFGFFGPRIAFPATGALWGRATPFFYHFSVHLSSVLGRTELCHEVWTPGPPKPQIINNENHHLALLELYARKLWVDFRSLFKRLFLYPRRVFFPAGLSLGRGNAREGRMRSCGGEGPCTLFFLKDAQSS